MKTKQTGSALIVSLLILLVMTMIGISAMSTSTMEEKMAANDRNQKIIFQRAEGALRAAENAVISKNRDDIRSAFADDDLGYYDDNVFNYRSHAAWNQGTNCIALPNNSCYIVEKVPNSEPSGTTQPIIMAQSYGSNTQGGLNQVLRITARSTDANNITTALLQSHLRK